MFNRKKTRCINVGKVAIGGDFPISVQSMTNTKTTDTAATVEQINALAEAGCDIVRLAVPTMDAAKNLGNIIKAVDVPLIAEYYKEDKMGWISKEKFITSLVFIDSNKVDENLAEMIEELKTKDADDPDLDKIAIMSEILGTYPCYLALVVSYQNNSPNSVGKNSYYIACRANKVIIKDPHYVYTPIDHNSSEEVTEPEDEYIEMPPITNDIDHIVEDDEV